MNRGRAVAVVGAAAVLGAIAHEACHAVVPALYGADVGVAWRSGVVVGGPSVTVSSAAELPAWVVVVTALSPLVLVAGYACGAALGWLPRRPWSADSIADGAALAFLVVALPSPDDLRQVLAVVV